MDSKLDDGITESMMNWLWLKILCLWHQQHYFPVLRPVHTNDDNYKQW